MRLIFILTVLFVMISCSNSSTFKATNNNFVDTTKSFKIDGYWITPKESFDLNSLGRASVDTLHLVTCSEFVYFPFGKLTEKSSLKVSLLKNFNVITSKRDTFTNIMLQVDSNKNFKQWSESIELVLDSNKLSLFLDNDQESSMHGYIREGKILDSSVLFINNIKVGIDIEDFYNKFFEYYPSELRKKYKVVKLESCVADVTHIYTFNNGKLVSVKFINQ